MIGTFRSLFDRGAAQKGAPLIQEPRSTTYAVRRDQDDRKPTYTKIFRYRLPDGQTAEPQTVEVVGSFNHWHRVMLTRDGKQDSWHAVVHHIPGNRTHHYMLLVDGKPTYDKTCDGLAVPHGPQEERYQLQTDKGLRVLMMFAQTR